MPIPNPNPAPRHKGAHTHVPVVRAQIFGVKREPEQGLQEAVLAVKSRFSGLPCSDTDLKTLVFAAQM